MSVILIQILKLLENMEKWQLFYVFYLNGEILKFLYMSVVQSLKSIACNI